MECIIPGKYMKVFAKAIQCFAKIGEDLYLEAFEGKLTLRTLNSSRSAFLGVTLDERFFDSYQIDSTVESLKYQVKLKPCAAVFKQWLNVENCTIRVDDFDNRLVFELMCKHGIKKVYKLAFEECDSIHAVYSKDNCLNKLVALPRRLLDCFNNFHTQLDEISLVVFKEGARVKSHVDDAKAASKVLQTELAIDPNDFEEFDIQNETQVTFCLKEAKTLLTFCEQAQQPVTILFERGGRPILLNMKFHAVLEADFVLATLVDPSSQQSSSNGTSSSQSSTTTSTPTSSAGGVRKGNTPSSIQSFNTTQGKRPSPSPTSPNPYSPNSSQYDEVPVIHSSTSTSVISSSASAKSVAHVQSQPNEEDTEDMYGDYEDEVSGSPQPLTKKQRVFTDSPASIIHTSSSSPGSNAHRSVQHEEEQEEDETMDEEVPCSYEEGRK